MSATEMVQSTRVAEDVGGAALIDSKSMGSDPTDVDDGEVPTVTDDQGVHRYKVNVRTGCTDVFFLLLFIVFWAGMIVIAVVANNKGNPERLVYATDYNGEVCNSGSNAGKPFIFYPNLAEAVFDKAQDPENVNLQGVCLDECPKRFTEDGKPTEITLPWDGSTYKMRFNTRNVFYRCIDDFHYYELDVAQCLYFEKDGKNVTGYNTGGLGTDARVNTPCIEYNKEFGTNVPCTTECKRGTNTGGQWDGDLRCPPGNGGDFLVVPCENTAPVKVFGDESQSARHAAQCERAVRKQYPKCTQIAMGKTSLTNQPSTDNPLYKSLMKWGAKVARWVGDLQKAAPAIVLCGVVLALAMGFLWTFIMQFCARLITWLTVVASCAMMLGLSLFCLAKGGVIDSDNVEAVANGTKVIPDFVPLGAHEELRRDSQFYYKTIGYVFLAMFCVLVLVIYALRQRIELAIAMIQQAAKAIRDMPLMSFFPIIPTLMLFGLLVYWLWVSANLASIDVGELEEIKNNATVTLGSAYEGANTYSYVLLYHFFGLLWTNQVIEGIQLMTVAGAVSRWYWKAPSTDLDGGGCCTDTFKSPTWNAFKRALRYHLGSLAFGGLIIAIVQMLRAGFEYISDQMKAVQNKYTAVKVVFCCLRCMLWCIEKCFKFITYNVYIVIAMRGGSFCSGAKYAFSLLSKNVKRVATVQIMSGFVMTLGRLMVVATCTLAMLGLIEDDGSLVTKSFFVSGVKTNLDSISSPVFPLIATVIISAVVADEFMDVFYMAIETILLSFCSDLDMNGKHRTYAMNDDLKKFMQEDAKKYAFKSKQGMKSDGLGNWSKIDDDDDSDEDL